MPVVNLTELRQFIPAGQLAVMRNLCRGEEGDYYSGKLIEFSQRVKTMPQIYEQDGLEDNAIAHLHYFSAGNDYYITERDFSDVQLQAMGVAVLDGNLPELGYICVAELIRLGVELNLAFRPTALKELRAATADFSQRLWLPATRPCCA